MNRNLALCFPLLLLACHSYDRDRDDERGDLELTRDATSIEGQFVHDGMLVEFDVRSYGESAVLDLEIDGKPLEITIDLQAQTLAEDAHGSRFELQHRDLLRALRDVVTEEHAAAMDTLVGMALVKTADRYAEMPIGRSLLRREITFNPNVVPYEQVLSGCGGDGVTCLPGTSGSSWAVFFASGICDARSTPYGDSVCRGRCGAGCSWWDEDYTWDCLDHDVCLDYSNDCDDEFNEAADDWAATFAPLCWSGTSRSKPPAAPKCGDGAVNVGEQCDDGNTAPDDGCSSTCQTEVVKLVINEIDYDQPSTDTAEFVEIFNAAPNAVALDKIALVLVNGSTPAEYGRTMLAGSLKAGGYLVVCAENAAIVVPEGTPKIHFATATNALQNGAPDGVALVDVSTGGLLDALSYEGAVTAAVINELGTFNLVEGNATTLADDGTFTNALVRLPNGSDTNDAATDWGKRAPSPGAPNPQ